MGPRKNGRARGVHARGHACLLARAFFLAPIYFLVPATQAMYVSCRHASGIVWTATAQNWNKSFTHIEVHAGAVGREAGEQNPSPQSWIFTSVSGDPSPYSHFFTSATVRIPVHSTPKYDTEPIRYVTLHFQDRRSAASLRYRNRAEITVLMFELKIYLKWFSRRCKWCYPA